MNEWRELAEYLVELDFEIEDLESWATRPGDVEELKELESLRDEVQSALERHHRPSRLQARLTERARKWTSATATVDPRD